VSAVPSNVCTAADAASPAFGKLKAGDVLVSINGQPINSDGTNFGAVLRRNAGRPVSIVLMRGGTRRDVTVTPVSTLVGSREVGRIGVEEAEHVASVGVGASFGRTFGVLGDFVKSTGSALGGLPHEVAGILEGKPRDQQGAASVVDVARVSGQVASSGGSVKDIAATLALILAELNLFIGIFNLLPLLPLDGGHVAILAFEEARTRIYRVIGRRDPGRVDIMKVLPLTYAVVAVFVGLSLILLYAGITNPIRLQ
jgi:membrane-associated protease RseP (regulator of RpoE activity)